MREIRGWKIGQVVTMDEMADDTANILEEIGSSGKANLPCIFNGLNLESQTGPDGSVVTFRPGVARCQDLPTSVFTYLPVNAYSDSYPCYIDINAAEANRSITLSPSITSGYIVATFSITPTTPGQLNYLVIGSLVQIQASAYNPAVHVRLCSFNYTPSTFTLDFTPKTSRDTDLTGLGGMQWNYQDSSLDIDTPASQAGSLINLKQNTIIDGILAVEGGQMFVDAITDIAGNGPVDFPHGITTNSFIPPVVSELTSLSGNYTTPTVNGRAPRHLHVRMTGPGGGGGGSAIGSSVSAGADGGNSSFGGFLLAEGGKGANVFAQGGLGGDFSINSPALGSGFRGQTGESGQSLTFPTLTSSPFSDVELLGGSGGNSLFGGGGACSAIGAGPMGDAPPLSGGGGAGAGILADTGTAGGNSIRSAAGGGGGAGIDAIIPNPGLGSVYSYVCGQGGAPGTGGSGGETGGRGANSKIIVIAHFQ